MLALFKKAIFGEGENVLEEGVLVELDDRLATSFVQDAVPKQLDITPLSVERATIGNTPAISTNVLRPSSPTVDIMGTSMNMKSHL